MARQYEVHMIAELPEGGNLGNVPESKAVTEAVARLLEGMGMTPLVGQTQSNDVESSHNSNRMIRVGEEWVELDAVVGAWKLVNDK